MQNRQLKLLFIPVFIKLAACSLLPAGFGDPATPTRSLSQRASPTPEVTASVVEPNSPACIQNTTTGALQFSTDQELPEEILAYLNAGYSPVALADQLNLAGAAGQPVPVAIADFTGDGKDDLATAIRNTDPERPGGRLLLFVCREQAYHIVLDKETEDLLSPGFHIWYWQDMDNNASAEIVVSHGTCGAHSCFEDVEILAWDGESFSNRLTGNFEELPYPDIRITDLDGDQFKDLEIASGGFGSAGAGPQRLTTHIWKFDLNTSVWQFAARKVDPSNFRIHVLHDADDATLRTDYTSALALYQRVIEEASLDNWFAEESQVAAVQAYARYRIAVIAVVLEEEQAIDAAFADLENRYPAGSPLRNFVDMAILFRNGFKSGGINAACSGAAGFALAHAEIVLDPLGSAVYGYANRDYSGESMCPVP